MKQIIIFLIATSVAFTQVPQRIAFQGVLTESNGVVSTKTSGTFTFSIWDDELSTSTANRIWFESNVSLPLTRGMFSYVIGKSKQLTIAFDKPYWLEVQEGTTTLPRIELTSNAYSMRAAIADSAVRAPVSTTLTQLMRDEIAKMIKDSLSNQNIPNDVPVGTIIAYAGESVPTKWLACDGTAIDRSGANGYAELFTAIGTNWGSPNATQFNLPDLRGMFLRGVNGTRSDTLSDPNAATRFVNRTGGLTGNRVGSIQADAFQGHWHSVHSTNSGVTSGGAGLLLTNTESSFQNWSLGSYTNVRDAYSDRQNGIPRTSSETRSKNAYVLYIIRAKP